MGSEGDVEESMSVKCGVAGAGPGLHRDAGAGGGLPAAAAYYWLPVGAYGCVDAVRDRLGRGLAVALDRALADAELGGDGGVIGPGEYTALCQAVSGGSAAYPTCPPPLHLLQRYKR
ncbi:hypothetical protein [Nocardia sp. NPDC058666]|uniref:hypothetical protein n=1 Tax=Nocardia sp. NPDC058666 TaxID=3346587 RepID=UPI00364CFC8F